jgi:hypothetical protein
MSEETRAVTLTEDRVPVEGIEETIEELVDLYGGELGEARERSRDFTLPLRRGVPTGGAIECNVSWAVTEHEEATVTMHCNRDIDAPKLQRVLLLLAGVIGSMLFMLWPFFPNQRQYGTLAWLGGAIAIAVYLMSLRKTSGGIAFDFLQRLARRQREQAAEDQT